MICWFKITTSIKKRCDHAYASHQCLYNNVTKGEKQRTYAEKPLGILMKMCINYVNETLYNVKHKSRLIDMKNKFTEISMEYLVPILLLL